MNYKLDNPVALKVIDCLMLDRPVPMTKVMGCARLFDYDLNQAVNYCLKHGIINNESALYIYIMYKTTFNDIIKNRNKELSMRNVTR